MLQPRLLQQRSIAQCTCLRSLIQRCYATAVVEAPLPPEADPQDEKKKSDKTPFRRDDLQLGLRRYKPISPGIRHLVRPINDHLWKGKAHRPLTFARKGQHIGGRNNSGTIRVRHRGGGHKRRIRMVDFDRMDEIEKIVERIEHDPGRSAHIALLRPKQFKPEELDERILTEEENRIQRLSAKELDAMRTYIVAAEGMREGDNVVSYRKGIPEHLKVSLGGVMDAGMVASKTALRGNCLPLHLIPAGTLIYNLGLRSGKGAQLCRSAGTYATIVNKHDGDERRARYCDVRLQSGEIRKLPRDVCATIGVASNPNYQHRKLGKAGRSRWLGIRPTVRGVAMNASDHPHGGGRGKSKGNVIPIDVWGRTPVRLLTFLPLERSLTTP